MNKQKIATTVPLLEHLFDHQITGVHCFSLVFKPTGRVLFGLHHYDEEDDPENAGYYIREEIGAARALLPEGFQKECFQSMQAARSYCLQHLYKLVNCCYEAIRN